jgi:hypothetical protein
MWQIMWMLALLPDWFWSATLAVGLIGIVAGWILKFIPFVRAYKSILRILGIVLVIVSVWFLGGQANEDKWQAKVKEMEERIAAAEAASAGATRDIQVQVVEKTKVVKGKTEYITQYLDREIVKKEEIVKFIENCPLPKDIIDVHNQAASIGEKK